MDWNNYNNTINPQNSSLPSRPPPPFSSSRLPHQYHDSASLSFFYNYNNHYDPYQVVEMKHDMSMMSGGGGYDLSQEKKKRLTTDQLESLENSFQEEIKLDPDRKMKLAKDLGLQPRQIAVWFQNRRARWKAKNLERLYDSIKQELDVMSRENQKLQEEVLALRAIVKEQGGYRKPASTAGYTEMSGTEETVESSSNRLGGGNGHQLTAAECSYVFNVNDYDPAATMATYWAGHQLPSYP